MFTYILWLSEFGSKGLYIELYIYKMTSPFPQHSHEFCYFRKVSLLSSRKCSFFFLVFQLYCLYKTYDDKLISHFQNDSCLLESLSLHMQIYYCMASPSLLLMCASKLCRHACLSSLFSFVMHLLMMSQSCVPF